MAEVAEAEPVPPPADGKAEEPAQSAGEPAAAPAAAVGQKREREEETLIPVPDEMSLPSAAIMRIIKSKLPDGVMVNKDAKTAFTKACSVFILYLTTMCARRAPSAPRVCPIRDVGVRSRSAADMSKEKGRSTLTAADVLGALRDLEFDEFIPTIETCLAGAPAPAPPPVPGASSAPTHRCAVRRAAFREADKAKALEAQAKRAARAQVHGEQAVPDAADEGEEAGADGDADADGDAAMSEEAADGAEESRDDAE